MSSTYDRNRTYPKNVFVKKAEYVPSVSYLCPYKQFSYVDEGDVRVRHRFLWGDGFVTCCPLCGQEIEVMKYPNEGFRVYARHDSRSGKSV